MAWEKNESANLVMSVMSSLCFPASAEETQDLHPVSHRAGKYQPACTNPKITAEK